jgi:hypothetical protein
VSVDVSIESQRGRPAREAVDGRRRRTPTREGRSQRCTYVIDITVRKETSSAGQSREQRRPRFFNFFRLGRTVDDLDDDGDGIPAVDRRGRRRIDFHVGSQEKTGMNV